MRVQADDLQLLSWQMQAPQPQLLADVSTPARAAVLTQYLAILQGLHGIAACQRIYLVALALSLLQDTIWLSALSTAQASRLLHALQSS